MNRSTTNSTTINQNLSTSIPSGIYSDYLGGTLGGKSISAISGTISSAALTLATTEIFIGKSEATEPLPLQLIRMAQAIHQPIV